MRINRLAAAGLGALGFALAWMPGTLSADAATTAGGVTRAPSQSAEVAPYSRHPAETRPYAVCPPPTQRRASCLAAVVPTEGGEPVVGPSLEGSGMLGGFSPADLRSAYGLPGAGGDGQDDRDHDRLRRSAGRGGPRDLPQPLRARALHHRQWLLQKAQPGRRSRQLPGTQNGLGAGDLARPRHGLGGLPELSHRPRRGRQQSIRRHGRCRGPRRRTGRDGDQRQLGQPRGLRRGGRRPSFRAPRDPGPLRHRGFGLRRRIPRRVARRDRGRRHQPVQIRQLPRLVGDRLVRRRQRLQRIRAKARLAA